MDNGDTSSNSEFEHDRDRSRGTMERAGPTHSRTRIRFYRNP